LSRFGTVVKEGYFSKRDLKYVPDIIVEWPSGEVWTFDYITGTKSEKYQQYISKKQKSYEGNGYKSYFLFDQTQLAQHPNLNALGLGVGEKGSLSFLAADPSRENLIREIVIRFGMEYILGDSRLMLKVASHNPCGYKDHGDNSRELARTCS
jgi:hypothetical protein